MLSIVLRAMLVLALLVLAAGAFMGSAPQPASLSSDVGMRDADVCAALAQSTAVDRLEAARFPHATTSTREVYRLDKVDGPTRTTEAQMVIDWNARTATCLQPDYAGPADATFELAPSAYNALVAELQHVATTGHAAFAPGNWWALTWHTSVHVYHNPAYDAPYKRAVASWAAGEAITGAWRGSA